MRLNSRDNLAANDGHDKVYFIAPEIYAEAICGTTRNAQLLAYTSLRRKTLDSLDLAGLSNL